MAHSPNRSTWAASAVGAAFLSAFTLILPWFEIAGRARSSIDLISSAGALELIDGAIRVLVVGLWLIVPILGAGALLLLASGRQRAAAVAALLVGGAVLAVLGVGLLVDGVALVWGAFLAGASAICAAVCAIMVLTPSRG